MRAEETTAVEESKRIEEIMPEFTPDIEHCRLLRGLSRPTSLMVKSDGELLLSTTNNWQAWRRTKSVPKRKF
jgi:hypothetical protein